MISDCIDMELSGTLSVCFSFEARSAPSQSWDAGYGSARNATYAYYSWEIVLNVGLDVSFDNM
jgi:hypothetical protein